MPATGRKLRKVLPCHAVVVADADADTHAQVMNSTVQLDQLLSNRLISLNILRFLHTPDLKALRQTCKRTLASVNCHPGFANNLQLTLCAENKSVLSRSTIQPWKKARILVGNKPFTNLKTIKNSLKFIEELDLDFADHPPKQMRMEIFELLDLPHIKSLGIHMKYIEWISYAFLQDSSTTDFCRVVRIIKKLVKSLDGLRIFGDANLENCNPRNVEVFGAFQWKLKRLDIESLDFPMVGIIAFLQDCSETIETINLPPMDNSFGYIGYLVWKNIEFPSLRHLKCASYAGEGELLGAFLSKQHRLQTLQVTCLHKNIPNSVLDAIKNTGAKLRELMLSGSHWLEAFPDEEQWQFLADFKKLEKFMISGKSSASNCDNITQPCIQYLSAGIHSIQLKRANSSRGFDWQAKTIRVLGTFTQLTELKIENCKRVLSDVILQSICKTLTKLRVLHLASHDITDFGLTGENRRGTRSGISLRNLNLLQDLSLTKSRSITLAGIKAAVQFLELRVLDVRCGAGGVVTEEDMLEIAKANPSLESIECFTVGSPSFACAVKTGRLKKIGTHSFKRSSLRLLHS